MGPGWVGRVRLCWRLHWPAGRNVIDCRMTRHVTDGDKYALHGGRWRELWRAGEGCCGHVTERAAHLMSAPTADSRATAPFWSGLSGMCVGYSGEYLRALVHQCHVWSPTASGSATKTSAGCSGCKTRSPHLPSVIALGPVKIRCATVMTGKWQRVYLLPCLLL